MAKYVKRASYLWAGVAYLWLRMLRCRAEKCDANAQNNGAMGVSVQGGWVGATFLLCPVKILMVKAEGSQRLILQKDTKIKSATKMFKQICSDMFTMYMGLLL